MADKIQQSTTSMLPSLDELEAASAIKKPTEVTALPSLEELDATAQQPQTQPQLPSLEELEAASPVSVRGNPLSPETQKILAEREKEKKAYETGYFGMGDIFKPEAREAIGGLWAALTTGKRTPEAEIKALAEKYEVSPEALREIAPFLLAIPEEKTLGDVNMQALGYVSEAAAGLPTFLIKKGLVDDPNMRDAIDDLRAMGKERLGLAEWIGINVIPGALVGKVLKGGAAAVKTGEAVTKGLARQAAESAVVGAAFGLGNSKEGQEVADTIVNATAGAALTPVIKSVPKAYKRVKDTFFKGSEKALQQADAVTQDTAIKYAANNEADITNAVDVAYEVVKDTEAAIRDAALKNRPMSPETASKVVAEMVTPDQRKLAENSIVDRYIKTLPRGERRDVMVPEGVLSDEAIAAEYVRMRQATFAEKIVEEAKDLATIIDEKTGKPRPASVKEVLREAQRLGADELDAKWDDAVREELANDLIKKKSIQLGDETPLFTRAANFFGGRQFGFKVIDERSGADVIPPFLQTNSNLNLVTAERQRWRKFDKNDPTGTISGIYRAGKAVKDFLKLATAQDETNKYWTALAHQNPEIRKATYEALSDAEKKLLGYVSNFFNKVRERANSVKGEGINPLNIPFREDFGAPNVTVKPTDYVIRLKGKLKNFEEATKVKLKDLQGEDLAKALGENKDLQDLIAGLRLIDEKLVNESLRDGKSLMAALRTITSGKGRGEALYRVAGTALARRGSIPEYLMEKNLFRLMDRYMDSTMRNVYLRRPLEELASKARILDRMGMGTEAEFVKRFVQDHYGIRAWSASKLYGEAQVAASDMARSVSRRLNLKPQNEEALVAAVNYIPEAIANIQYNIYPNVLGMNGKSHVTNLLQAWTKGAPELGRLYGYNNVGRSFFTAMAPSNWKRLMGKVKEWGLLPDTYVKEFAPAVEEGLARSTGWQFTKEQYQKFVNAWMYSYSKVEDFNRMVIVNMSETLVQDAINGNKGAVRAIAKMPLAIRRAYIRNKGNPEQQTKIVAKYLNSVTGYNYNRSSMAEVGVHLGPFFATFTKWPTETLGDVLADMRINGTGKAMPRLLEKYALTLALMNGIDATLHWAATDNFSMFPDLKETEPQVRYWLGTSGLKTAAPIYSLGQLMPATKEYERNPFTPVVLSTMWNDILMPAWEGDTEKMRTGGMRALQTFAPFGMMSRFLMRDIPMAFEGEEPTKFKGK